MATTAGQATVNMAIATGQATVNTAATAGQATDQVGVGGCDGDDLRADVSALRHLHGVGLAGEDGAVHVAPDGDADVFLVVQQGVGAVHGSHTQLQHGYVGLYRSCSRQTR